MELYLHIPFCVRKCKYCDFLSFPMENETMGAYGNALLRDVKKASAQYSEEKITSIFFGGGTPSLLPAEAIPTLLSSIRDGFVLTNDCEVTVECNPGTLTEEKLQAFYAAGVNRISMGVQSADDGELRTLGRIHTFAEAVENFHLARKVGFDNISVDVMMALPGQTPASYKETLERIIALAPEHISAYDLIVEEGTCFYDWYEREPEAFPTEECSCEMYRMTQRELTKAGYEQYEISNYAKPGRRSRHNYGYWSNVPYLGLGLGASSYIGNRRFRNTDDLKQYLQGNLYIEDTILSERDMQEEFFILGLRRREGITEDAFVKRFSADTYSVYEKVLCEKEKQGLVEKTKGGYRLSEEGILLSNTVFVALMDAEKENKEKM